MKKILIIVGTRPNFIKVTQFKRVAAQYPDLDFRIAHTGQHYDKKMSQVFFEQFGLVPDFWLNVSTGSPATKVGLIIQKLYEVMTESFTPDLVMVVGDVDSTLAAAIAAQKAGLPIAHLESGLRSYDRGMPEEINRILTDEITDLYFITEQSGVDNLDKEGKVFGQRHFVGNTMIDTLVAFQEQIQASPILDQLGLEAKSFALMTIHRPATVDNQAGLESLLELLHTMLKKEKVVFPIHPRTLKRFKDFGLYGELSMLKGLILSEPMDYFAFQKLIASCKYVLTDSGGIQEETTFSGVPCLTLRPNTERPSTIELGSNTLVPFELDRIQELLTQIEMGTYKSHSVPPLWDGKATERIVSIIQQYLVVNESTLSRS